MKGRKMKAYKVSKIKAMSKKGYSNQAISDELSVGYSTVCRLTSTTAKPANHRKVYAVAVDKKAYDYVSGISKNTNKPRSEVLSNIVNASQRKRWLFF